MRLLKTIAVCAFQAGVPGGALWGDEDLRLAEISAQQEQKATQLKPEQQGKLELGLLRLGEDALLEQVGVGIAGFRPKMGGMTPGSGFAIGPEFFRGDLLNGQLSIRTSAEFSTRRYQKYAFEIALPRLSGGRYFAQFNAVRHDYSSMSFYGSGPDSVKTGRSNFRLEDTSFDGTFGIRPMKRFSLGASAGYLLNNVGPGVDTRYISAEKIYSPAQAPGIDKQSNFVRAGGFAQYDWRDIPGGARRGGNYFVQFGEFRDRTFGLNNFRRLDLEAQQFVSVLNQRRVFALRARSTFTFRDGGLPVPFYLQPTLGGSEDLRGYRPFRFRDNNLVLMNGEYRWEVFSGLDMAAFVDAGKVLPHKSNLNLHNLESDLGFGFRFNIRDQTFLRLDVGFSHEGFQVWVRFNNMFRKGPVRTSSSMGDF